MREIKVSQEGHSRTWVRQAGHKQGRKTDDVRFVTSVSSAPVSGGRSCKNSCLMKEYFTLDVLGTLNKNVWYVRKCITVLAWKYKVTATKKVTN